MSREAIGKLWVPVSALPHSPGEWTKPPRRSGENTQQRQQPVTGTAHKLWWDTHTPSLPTMLLAPRSRRIQALKEGAAAGRDWLYHSRAPFLHTSVCSFRGEAGCQQLQEKMKGRD